jgi:hypothetical protein
MKLRKFNNKAVSGALVAVLFIMMFAAVGVVGYGSYTNWKFQLGNNNNNNNVGGGGPKGSYTFECYAFDSLATTTTRTIATDVIVSLYKQTNGVWQQLATAVSATVGSFTLDGSENGIIYAIVTTSSSYYLDVARTTAMNNIMTYIGYENVLPVSTLPQFVYKLNVNGIVPGSRTTADINLNFYAITYAAIVFGTQPTNVTGVGTALNTTYAGFYMSEAAVSEGAFVRQITLSTNDTSPATQTLYRVNIPGVGFTNGGTWSVQTQASAILYTWTAPSNPLTGATDLGSCVPWTYSSGSVNKFDLTTAIQTTLTAALKDRWAITVYWLTPAGAGASATQDWELVTTLANS